MIFHNRLDFFKNSCAKVTYFEFKVRSPRLANIKNCWNLRMYVLFRDEVKFNWRVVANWNLYNKNGFVNRVQKVEKALEANTIVGFRGNITSIHLEICKKYWKGLNFWVARYQIWKYEPKQSSRWNFSPTRANLGVFKAKIASKPWFSGVNDWKKGVYKSCFGLGQELNFISKNDLS